MLVIRYRKLFVALSLALVGLSALSLFVFGLKPSIDFTGGTILEVSTALSKEEAAGIVESVARGTVSARPTDGGYILRTRTLSPEEQRALEHLFAEVPAGAAIERVSSIGPALGEELFNKALIAIMLVSLGIMLFVAVAFWRVSKPVSSWVYGLVTLGTLVHDVIIPAGVFALLGATIGLEVDALFIVALLTVLGYSVNDTIVVMDRIRENLRINEELGRHEEYERSVGKSLKQTYARSINTSLTTIAVLVALFFLGGSQTEDFALALLIGVAAGAYSSIFFASPMLVIIEQWSKKKKS